jgi:hypothetical protein
VSAAGAAPRRHHRILCANDVHGGKLRGLCDEFEVDTGHLAEDDHDVVARLRSKADAAHGHRIAASDFEAGHRVASVGSSGDATREAGGLVDDLDLGAFDTHVLVAGHGAGDGTRGHPLRGQGRRRRNRERDGNHSAEGPTKNRHIVS